jgi:ankyrin repeat protein
MAATSGHTEVCSLLLDRGANIEKKTTVSEIDDTF